VGALIVFLASPLPYYTFRRPLMAHSAEFFALSLLALFSLRFMQKRQALDAVMAGLATALAVGVRYPDVFIVTAWWLGLLYLAWRRADFPALRPWLTL